MYVKTVFEPLREVLLETDTVVQSMWEEIRIVGNGHLWGWSWGRVGEDQEVEIVAAGAAAGA
jgi:hypothetical protein